MCALAGPAETATEPAVAEQHLQAVLAVPQQRGDVVSLVAQAMVVTRPARREYFVADPGPVHRRLINTMCRNVKPRRRDARPQ